MQINGYFARLKSQYIENKKYQTFETEQNKAESKLIKALTINWMFLKRKN
jgi:hypothetical protein